MIRLDADPLCGTLEFFGSTDPAASPEVALYIPRPRWLPDDTILVPDAAYTAAIISTSEKIKSTSCLPKIS